MTEEVNVELSDEQLAEATEGQEQQQEEQQEVNTEVEDKARVMGWKPKEEYKGDPNRWTDAETFVKVGEERIPVMKENYRKLEDKFKNLEDKLTATQEFQKESSKRQYERAMKDLQEQQRQAVEEADTETFDKIEKQKEQIEVDYSPKESTQSQKPREVAEWESRNTWYQNPTLADKAVKLEQRIMEEEAYKQSQDPFYQPMQLGERLNEVTRRVQADFQQKPAPARKLPAVEGTRQTGTGKKPAKTWSDLPEDAKAAATAYERAGVLTKADYIKDYFGE
jgi:hypothetical protein